MNEMGEYIEEAEATAPSSSYKTAVTTITVCLALIGAFTIYSVFTSDVDWGFKFSWNCFESKLFVVLSILGFFLQFINWQHASTETWIGTKKEGDRDYKWEKSNDVMDVLFGKIVWPLISHLLIFPCMYGAIMWYAIMGLIYLLGKMTPIFISILVIGLIFLFYKMATNVSDHKYRVAFLVAFTILGASILAGTSYAMSNPSMFSSEQIDDEAASLGTCLITGNGVNLRQGPGTEYDKIGVMVSAGETYPLLEDAGEWVKINYNGTPAWLSSKFCELNPADNGTETIIETVTTVEPEEIAVPEEVEEPVIEEVTESEQPAAGDTTQVAPQTINTGVPVIE